MKKLICALVAICMVSAMAARTHQKQTLTKLCQNEAFEAALPQPGQFEPVPRAGDPYWTESVPESIRKDFIKEGEKALKGTWPTTDVRLFSEFRKNGNRVNYEKVIFDKRKRLASLVMAELLEGKGRFMDEIINGVQSMCEETWWGIPAHYPDPVPVREKQPLDLFNGDSGALAAWAYYLFGDKIKEFSPILYDEFGAQIKRRILDEGLNTREWWRCAGMNWNPWICSNWLVCVMLVEPDRDRQLQAMRAIAESVDGFVDSYPEDGGCDEGAGYWDRAGGSLLDCLTFMHAATGGYIDMADDDLVDAIASYVCKMNIDNDHVVNFADASPTLNIRPQTFSGAKLIGNKELMSLAASSLQRKDYVNHPSRSFDNDCILTIWREVQLLRNLDDALAAAGADVLPFDSWSPRVEVITARSNRNSSDGIYFAAKGGHNNESHNHNDVGSFIVYVDGSPLFVDPGNVTYTGSSFNNERYKTWNVQSGYHNLPKINGVDQRNGAQYKSKDVKQSINGKKVRFSLDIADAYPQEAKVKSWLRTIDLQRGKSLSVTEDYKLAERTADTDIVLMSQAKPEIGDGAVTYKFGDKKWQLTFDPKQMRASMEPVACTDGASRGNWGQLYRLKLTILSPALSGKVTYILTPAPLSRR